VSNIRVIHPPVFLVAVLLIAHIATEQTLTKSTQPSLPAHQNDSRSEVAQSESLVQSLYAEVVARHPLGISVGGQLKVFAPYLSKALLHRIDVANTCMDDWDRQHQDPNAKPPGLEDGLFTGSDMRAEPHAFHIERVSTEKDGSTHVYVRLTRNEPGESPWIWRVAAILTRENSHLVVDDIIYLKDKPRDVEYRLSEYLSDGCDGPHWVGHKEKR